MFVAGAERQVQPMQVYIHSKEFPLISVVYWLYGTVCIGTITAESTRLKQGKLKHLTRESKDRLQA